MAKNKNKSQTQTVVNEVGDEIDVHEGKTIPAVIKGHAFEALVVAGKPSCPHCMRNVAPGNLVDLAKLEAQAAELEQRAQVQFRAKVAQANRNRTARGLAPLSSEKVAEMEAQFAELYGT